MKVVRLIKITELSKILALINPTTEKPQNHTLRFWEKKFKQIKPKIINKQRYYSTQQVELIKFINHLIKVKGMKINSVKKALKSEINKLDDHNSHSLKADYYKLNIKKRTFEVLKRIKKLKENGKKNTHKS